MIDSKSCEMVIRLLMTRRTYGLATIHYDRGRFQTCLTSSQAGGQLRLRVLLKSPLSYLSKKQNRLIALLRAACQKVTNISVPLEA